MKQLGVGQPVRAPIVDRNDVADVHVAGTATAYETGFACPARGFVDADWAVRVVVTEASGVVGPFLCAARCSSSGDTWRIVRCLDR